MSETVTVTPVVMRKLFRSRKKRDRSQIASVSWRWFYRRMKRKTDLAYSLPHIEVEYEPMTRVALGWLTWEEAVLPEGSGIHVLIPTEEASPSRFAL